MLWHVKQWGKPQFLDTFIIRKEVACGPVLFCAVWEPPEAESESWLGAKLARGEAPATLLDR